MVVYYKLDHSEPEYRSQMLARADGKWVKRVDYETDLAAARAEIERLTKELEEMTATKDIHQKKRHEYFERAEKAEAERDEARASLRHMEGFDRCTCGPCAIHGTAMLADAERDMRQRAADACRISPQDQAEVDWGSEGMDMSIMLRAAILALPLKHADRETKQ